MYMCGSNWWLITLILQTKIFKNGRKLLKEWFTLIFNAYTCVVTLDKFLKNIYIVSLRSLKIGYKHLLGVHLRWTVVPSRGSRWLIRLLPLKLGMSTGPICMCFHCSEMYFTNSAQFYIFSTKYVSHSLYFIRKLVVLHKWNEWLPINLRNSKRDLHVAVCVRIYWCFPLIFRTCYRCSLYFRCFYPSMISGSIEAKVTLLKARTDLILLSWL